MRCSTGLIAVGLARNLLQVAPHDTNVLIVSTEILSLQYYIGTERTMLLPNCLFRMGAATMFLSNSPEHARFKLKRVVRTVTAARDTDYWCVFQEEDGQGIMGIYLSKDLATTAGHAFKSNITTFGPPRPPRLRADPHRGVRPQVEAPERACQREAVPIRTSPEK
jgi:3-ketoacyl-CoA synthase